MFDSLQVDSWKKKIHQSHKNTVTLKSMPMFIRMAYHKDILSINKKATGEAQKKLADSLKSGVKFQDQIIKKDPDLNRFRLHYGLTNDEENDYEDGEEDLEEEADDLSSNM